MMFISKYGGQCGWEWIPIQVLRRICGALDKIHPLGCDYRMLAEVLDVHGDKLQQLLRFCSTSRDNSITKEILQVRFLAFEALFISSPNKMSDLERLRNTVRLFQIWKGKM